MSRAAPDQPDLTVARKQVEAVIAGAPLASVAATADAPLRRLSPELEAKLAALRQPPVAGLDVRRRVVVPSGVLAVVDAGGIVAGVATGNVVLAVGAAVLFVPLAALSVLGARFARGAAPRLTVADRRAIAAARQWRSPHAWTGPLTGSRERGLVVAAARAAEQIARSAPWRDGRVGDQRLLLDLGAELDQIDDQAHRIATARVERSAAAPLLDAAWDAALTRVAALTAYADQLRALDAAPRQTGDPVRDAELLAGSVGDEMALDRLNTLRAYLIADPGDPLG